MSRKIIAVDTPASPTDWHLSPRILATVLVALAALTVFAYWPALQGPFVFDDELLISRNVHVHALDRLGQIFSSSLTEGAGVRSNFYRPLQLTVYAFTYQLFGDGSTLPWHLLSLAMHLAAGLLLARLLLRLGLAHGVAIIATAVFWLHPAQSQAVAYISGLADPLAWTLMLGALLRFAGCVQEPPTTAARGWISALSIGLLMLLALLSKESAVVLAPLLLVLAWYLAWRQGHRLPPAARAALAGAILLAALWSALKLSVLNFTDTFGLSMIDSPYTRSLWVRLISFVHTVWDYAVLALYPAELYYDRPLLIRDSLLSWRAAFGLALLALLGLAFWQRRRVPRLALASGMLAAPMLPFIGVVPLNAGYLEHWLYVPMAGIGLLAGLGFTQLQRALAIHPGWRALPLLAACGLTALAVTRVHQRSAEWADPERFYRNELAHGAHSLRVYNNLGKLYAERGQLDLAERHFEQAVALQGPNRIAQAHHNLAQIQIMRGRYRESLVQLHQALQLDPRFLPSLQLLERVQAQLGDRRGELAAGHAIEAVQNRQDYRLDTLGLP